MAKLVASDAEPYTWLGISVAVCGDTAVVGARYDSEVGESAGAGYIFVRSGGVWAEQAKLTASDAAPYAEFGCSVAVSGDTAVIGAYGDYQAGGGGAGSAYVFVRAGGVWSQQAKLIASDAAPNDYFGLSVAVSGDTAVIGAYGDDGEGSLTGSAYIFARSGGVWTQQAKLTASDAAEDDAFGWSVAVSGDTAVIGAHLDTHAGGCRAGSAYVFARSTRVWAEQAKLTASDASQFDNFGCSVAVSGDTAVIGADLDDDAGSNSGSAYVFVRSGGVWAQQAKLTASDAAAYDIFGISVAVSDDTAMVGAYCDDHDGGANAGSAYVFSRSGGVWTEQAKLTASDAAEGDRFGASVAVSGDTAMIGACYDDHDGGTDAGSAYVFDLNCVGACCLVDGTCLPEVSVGECAVQGGSLLAGASCDPNPCPQQWCLGDMDCSGGAPTFDDIKYFAAAVGSESGWWAYYRDKNGSVDPSCPWLLGDYSTPRDGVNFDDIRPFAASIGGACQVYVP